MILLYITNDKDIDKNDNDDELCWRKPIVLCVCL